MNKLKIGLCQVMPGKYKAENIEKAKNMICQAADKGAKIIALPEMFNCPYSSKYFRDYGEIYPKGETLEMLSKVSKDKNVYLVGGSIPELDNEKNIYNTSYIFNNEGKVVGKHRKIHLFDVDIKNGISFKESDVLREGKDVTIVDTPWGKIGVAICYDIRFPELIRIMALKGAKIIFIPAAFSMATGPAHWELLFRSRALDNQIYMIGISPARNPNQSYRVYGNSLLVDPWGGIINKLDEKEGILVEDIDLNYISQVREELPLLKHRREDIYKLDIL